MTSSTDWYPKFADWLERLRQFRPTPEQAVYLNSKSATFPDKTEGWEQVQAWPILAILFHHGPLPQSTLLGIGALDDDLECLTKAGHIQAYAKGREQWYKLTSSAYTYWNSPPWSYRPYEM